MATDQARQTTISQLLAASARVRALTPTSPAAPASPSDARNDAAAQTDGWRTDHAKRPPTISELRERAAAAEHNRWRQSSGDMPGRGQS